MVRGKETGKEYPAMNKRITTFAVVMFMLITVCGCGQKDIEGKSEDVQIAPVETTAEPTKEPVPGVKINKSPVERDSQGERETDEESSDIIKLPIETSTQQESGNADETTPTASDQTNKVDNAKPTNPEKEPTDGSAEVTENTVPTEEKTSTVQKTEYETYQEMSGQEQKQFMESFSSIDAFFDWYNNAKEGYETANKSIVVGDGSIDLSEIVGKQNQ